MRKMLSAVLILSLLFLQPLAGTAQDGSVDDMASTTPTPIETEQPDDDMDEMASPEPDDDDEMDEMASPEPDDNDDMDETASSEPDDEDDMDETSSPEPDDEDDATSSASPLPTGSGVPSPSPDTDDDLNDDLEDDSDDEELDEYERWFDEEAYDDSTRRAVLQEYVRARQAGGDDSIPIIVNGMVLKPDVAPVLINGRVLVPARSVADAMGAQVLWNAADPKLVVLTRTVLHTDGTTVFISIRIRLDSGEVWVNDVPVALDVKPRVILGRTMIPFRFIAETFHHDVTYDPVAKGIFIDVPTDMK